MTSSATPRLDPPEPDAASGPASDELSRIEREGDVSRGGAGAMRTAIIPIQVPRSLVQRLLPRGLTVGPSPLRLAPEMALVNVFIGRQLGLQLPPYAPGVDYNALLLVAPSLRTREGAPTAHVFHAFVDNDDALVAGRAYGYPKVRARFSA